MSSQEEEAARELAALLRQVEDSSSGAATEEEDSGTYDMGCSAEFNAPGAPNSCDMAKNKGRMSPSIIERTILPEMEEGYKCDQDVVIFTQDLQGALSSVVQSAGRYLWGVKERLRHEGLLANERYKKDHAEEMIRLDKSIHSHSMDLEKAEAEVSGMRQKVTSVQEKSIEQRGRREAHLLKRLIFLTWKSYSRSEATKRQAVEEAMLTAARRRAAMRWFNLWARATLASKLEREQALHASSLEGISKEIVRKYEHELKRLGGELTVARQELTQEVAKRHRTKEELHRTFLKGWTRTNIEALALLGQQSGLASSATQHQDASSLGVMDNPNSNALLAAFEQVPQNGTVPYDEQPRPPLALEPSRHYQYAIRPPIHPASPPS